MSAPKVLLVLSPNGTLEVDAPGRRVGIEVERTEWKLDLECPALMILLALLVPVLAQEPKLEPEDLVARHLEALGPPELLSALQNRTAQGAGRVEMLQGGVGSLEGTARFVSEGRKLFLSIQFDELNYTAEEVSFDGEECYVGTTQPGLRSQLGQFLYEYDDLVREGLLGGVLSTAWPLLDLESRRPRLDYEGLKKVSGQELLELRYRMRKGGGDLNIRLYFDPESFRTWPQLTGSRSLPYRAHVVRSN